MSPWEMVGFAQFATRTYRGQKTLTILPSSPLDATQSTGKGGTGYSAQHRKSRRSYEGHVHEPNFCTASWPVLWEIFFFLSSDSCHVLGKSRSSILRRFHFFLSCIKHASKF